VAPSGMKILITIAPYHYSGMSRYFDVMFVPIYWFIICCSFHVFKIYWF
jgi:hypothetical protein